MELAKRVQQSRGFMDYGGRWTMIEIAKKSAK